MAIPDTLALKIAHFRENGRLVARDMDLFGPASWLAVHIGQLNDPRDADPLLDRSNGAAASTTFIDRLSGAMASMAQSMPTHETFLKRLIG